MKNIAQFIKQQLLNRSRNEKRPFAELLQYYGMERFLYRLSQSEYRELFILEGALMLQVWDSPQQRPTKDIDLLGRMNNDREYIYQVIQNILKIDIADDGILFDKNSIKTEEIKEEAEYHGVRIKFLGFLESSRINMQIDIGFGDVVVPEPQLSNLPTQLDQDPPRLLCYSKESAIAEKLEAMIKLDILNSRMKYFFDIWLLSRQFSFSGKILAEAIVKTFENRGTPIPQNLTIFRREFLLDKQKLWSAFRKRIDLDFVPLDFSQIMEEINSFLTPIIESGSLIFNA